MILNEQSNLDRRELEFLRDDQDDSYNQSFSDGYNSRDGSNEEQDMNYGDNTNIKRQDEISRDETTKQIIKVDCFEKLKGYFGFGQHLTTSFIGFVFVIPISVKWSFKLQAMIAQLAIICFAFTLLIIIKYTGQSIAQQLTDDWRNSVYDQSIGTLLNDLRSDFDKILSSTLLQNQQIMEESYDFILNQINNRKEIIDQAFLQQIQEFSTYKIYQSIITNENASINNSTLIIGEKNYLNLSERFLSLNYIIPFLNNKKYSTILYYYFSFFNGSVDLQFPGESLSESQSIQTYREYHQSVLKNISQNQTQQFQFNQKYEKLLSYYQFKLTNLNGTSYYAMSLMKLEELFIFLHQNTSNIKIIIQNMKDNSTVINQVNNLKPQEFDKMNNLSIVNQSYSKLQSSNLSVTYFYFNTLQRDDYGLKFFFLYNVSQVSQLINQQHKNFQDTAEEYERMYFPVFITIPFCMFFLYLILLSRRILPIEQITEIAYLSLKKNQKLNQEELDQISGYDSIKQLIQLFKNLISELAGLKVGNKESLSQHYKQQSYPFNPKERDLQNIREQILKFKGINLTEIEYNQNELNKIKLLKLIPQQEE